MRGKTLETKLNEELNHLYEGIAFIYSALNCFKELYKYLISLL